MERSKPAGLDIQVRKITDIDGRVLCVELVEETEEKIEVVASCDFSRGDVHYLASPLSAPTYEGIYRNAEQACGFMASFAKRGLNTYAPHGFAYMYEENYREKGLEFGLTILENCVGIVVCGLVISKGMKAEIEAAKKLGLLIFPGSAAIGVGEYE